MKFTALFLLASLALISCEKGGDDPQNPATVDNGPLGGTYALTAVTTNIYDTIPGSGIVTTNHYVTTTTNQKGTLTVTKTNISSKGLMFDYVTNGTRKETNTSTGQTITTNQSPLTGSSGTTTSSYNSNYTINTTAGELTIDDAQYLFNPGFLSQPSNKKSTYTLTGNVLRVVTTYYDAGSKYRSVNESTFTKQ